MIRWPWVSVRAFDLLVAENARLLAQNTQMLDHVTRMDRVEHGKGEIPRAPRAELEPMPKELLDFFNGLASPKTAKFHRDAAYRAHATQHMPWTDIMAEHIPPEPVDEPEPAAH